MNQDDWSDSNANTLKANSASLVLGTEELFADRFQLLKLVGEGGWSKVYQAREVRTDRNFALKLLHGDFCFDDEKLDRFQQEAKAGSRLSHPALAAIDSFGYAKDQPFIVMEFVEGKTLSEMIKETGALDLETFTDIFAQVCAGIGHAHEHNIVHRDIKPSNIMVQEKDGKRLVKVVDFGLAKLRSEGQSLGSLTAAGETVGTPSYMSPEQCRGQRTTPASDVYSLGCTMHQALIGKPLFGGATHAEIMMQHLAGNVPELPEKVPTHIRNVIYRALEKEPENRFANATELHDALIARSSMPATFSSYFWMRLGRRFAPQLRAVGAVAILCITFMWYIPSVKQNPTIEELSVSHPNRSAQELKQDIERLTKQIANEPKNAALYASRAKYFDALDDTQHAMADRDKSVELAPQDMGYLVQRANYRIKLGDDKNAMSDIRAVIAREPNNAAAWNLAALIEGNAHNWESVLKNARQSIKLDPKQAPPYVNLALGLSNLGRHSEAMDAASMALRLNPTLSSALVNRAKSLSSVGRYDEALKDLKSAIEREPRDAYSYELRAWIYERQGNEAMAKREKALAKACEQSFGKISEFPNDLR